MRNNRKRHRQRSAAKTQPQKAMRAHPPYRALSLLPCDLGRVAFVSLGRGDQCGFPRHPRRKPLFLFVPVRQLTKNASASKKASSSTAPLPHRAWPTRSRHPAQTSPHDGPCHAPRKKKGEAKCANAFLFPALTLIVAPVCSAGRAVAGGGDGRAALRACLWPPPAPSLPVCLFCFFSQAASLLPRAAGMPAGVVGAAALLGALGPGNGRCAWARVGDCGDDARRGPNFPRQWEQAGKEEEVEVRSGAWE